MLDDKTKLQLHTALDALRLGNTVPWNALAPLSRIAAAGTDISIDFTTEASLGVPVIVARPRARALPGLTPRQGEVCAALAQGLSNKAIALQLGISPSTVKDHVHAILDRLELKSRAEVVALLHRPIASKPDKPAPSI